MKELFNDIEAAFKQEMELGGIYITSPVILKSNGKNKARYEAGDCIKVQDEKLVHHFEGEKYTHKIIACWGDVLNSSLNMSLINLETNEPLILKIK